MEPLHPPYAPNTIQPRILNRWLDVNSQNGPLTRTQTFIQVPAFSVANTWLGYSDIVAAFPFSSPNSFSITGILNKPSNPNYMMCIAWADDSGVVYRYSLWSGVGENVYFDIPRYTNQLIRKNFRIEVWSTNNTPIVNVSPITIYTSVLTNVDYRFGTDSALTLTSGVVTNFSESGLPQDINAIIHPDVGTVYLHNVNPAIPASVYCSATSSTLVTGHLYDRFVGNADGMLINIGGVYSILNTPFAAIAGASYYYWSYDIGNVGQTPTSYLKELTGNYNLPLTFPNPLTLN